MDYTHILINLAFSTSLSTMFYMFHHKKYDTMLIFALGNMIALIVTFFITIKIDIGTGIGLFAIFSLMHFRENYNTYTMLYIFLSLSGGILASLASQSGDLNSPILITISVSTLIILLLLEKFLGNVKKVEYTVLISEAHTVEEMVRRDHGDVSIQKISIPKVQGKKAKVIVSYKKK